MIRLFISGTGTEIGKTVISSAIAHGMCRLGMKPAYWKPVQCGLDNEDRQQVRRMAPGSRVLNNGYSFKTAASPDQAAKFQDIGGASLDHLMEELTLIREDPLLIEGAGGLLVPLNDSCETWLDLIFQTELASVLVAQSGLGTINHTALSLKAMYARGLSPRCIILTGHPHQANLSSLQRMFPELKDRFYTFPFLAGLEKHPLWDAASEALASFVCDTKEIQEDPRPDDKQFVWHPFTQHATAPAPVAITRARGPWLKDLDGKMFFDATSSWWVNTIGHGRPEIAEAIARQQQTLDHTIFGGSCHSPAANLARKIVALAGGSLKKVFFTDNGSCAVEVAMKIAIQSFHNQGLKRSKFVCLKGGYHGDTFGAMAVGKSSGFYTPFQHHLFDNLWLTPVTEHPSAVCPEGKESLDKNLRHMEELFATQKDNIAGVLIEPWLQGAAGMVVQHLPWLQKLGEIANAHRIPLILDEVFTGMGRTGAFFAFQRAGLKPDIICTSKGLTGGNLPLALTITTDEIFEHFLSQDHQKTFFHGHSFTANPIACAAALATLEIYEKEGLVKQSLKLERRFTQWIAEEGTQLKVVQPRSLGGMLAFELPGSEFGNYFSSRNTEITTKARQHHILLRPLGNTIYLVPPLTTKMSEIDWALDRLTRVLS